MAYTLYITALKALKYSESLYGMCTCTHLPILTVFNNISNISAKHVSLR